MNMKKLITLLSQKRLLQIIYNVLKDLPTKKTQIRKIVFTHSYLKSLYNRLFHQT